MVSKEKRTSVAKPHSVLFVGDEPFLLESSVTDNHGSFVSGKVAGAHWELTMHGHDLVMTGGFPMELKRWRNCSLTEVEIPKDVASTVKGSISLFEWADRERKGLNTPGPIDGQLFNVEVQRIVKECATVQVRAHSVEEAMTLAKDVGKNIPSERFQKYDTRYNVDADLVEAVKKSKSSPSRIF